MKRFGYRAAFAGGVESTASMGGQLMPPVMGAVAFIMAETLGVEYVEVVTAAVIPAILYFGSAFWMVHLEAGRAGLTGLSREDLPSPIRAIRKSWHLLFPLAALVYLLFAGYTPLFAGTTGLALTLVLILGASAALGLPRGWLRVVFWVGIGILSASALEYGLDLVIWGLVALVLWNAFTKGGRETLILCRDSLADGARTALPVGVACALVGVIIGTMTLTGAATTFGQFIVHVGDTSLFLSLVLTMITCMVLGMGIPTIPNYIITSSIAGPALLALGVPLIVSHMFVFYFGIALPRPLTPTDSAGLFRGGADRQGKRAEDFAQRGQDRGGGLRHSLHVGLYSGTDASARRCAGRGDRLCSGRRLCRREDGNFHCALGRRGDRLAWRAARALGTRAGDRGRLHADCAAADGRGGAGAGAGLCRPAMAVAAQRARHEASAFLRAR